MTDFLNARAAFRDAFLNEKARFVALAGPPTLEGCSKDEALYSFAAWQRTAAFVVLMETDWEPVSGARVLAWLDFTGRQLPIEPPEQIVDWLMAPFEF